MRKILSMMISICAASALFAADDYYLANDNGVLKQVIKVNGVYKYADGSGYPDRNIFILGKLFDTQNNTGSMFMGEGANVMKGINNIAIGKNAQVKLSLADQGDSLAIGHFATATETNATAIGAYSLAAKINDIAIGPEAQALGGNSVAIGKKSQATGTDAIAIGNNAQATINNAIAIGQNSEATHDHAVAFGIGANASGQFSQAIGTSAESKGTHSNAIGFDAKSLGENALAFGSEAEAQKDNSIAFGNNAKAQEKEAIAIGSQAIAKKDETVAVGKRAQALADKTTAIGSNSQASNMNSTAVGYFANADGSSATALGAGTYAEDSSVAIGVNAKARGDGKNSIVIGQNTLTQSENTIVIGSNSQIGEGINTDKSYNSIAIGNDIKINRIINNAIALGYKAEVTSSENIAIGSNAKALHLYSSAIGTSAEAENESAAFGHSANAKMGSTAFGYQAKADKNSNAIGMSSVATGQYSSAIGHEAKATGNYSTAIGWDTQARGEDSIAMGGYTTASKNAIAMGRAAHAATNSVSIGYLADANNNANSVALGGNTRTDADGSVALGSYSWANRGELNYTGKYYVYRPAGYDEGIDATIKNTKGAVSVGKSGKDGFTRQIINVAAGSEDSDAVNVAQLKAVGKKGLNFKTDFGDDTQVLEDRFKNNSIHKSLGSTVAINGDYVLPFSATINGEPARIYDFLSGNNLATSVNEDGSIKLLMAKSPEFEGIEFGDKAKDDDFVYITRGDRSNSLAFYSYDKNNKENPTILENIAAGTKDTDAVNVSQLKENRIKYFSVTSDKTGVGSNYDNDGAIGKEAVAIGPNAIVETNAASSVAIGDGAKVEADAASAVAIGHKANAQKTNSIAIGSNTKSGDSSVAIGLGAKTGEGVVDKASYNKIEKELNNVKRKYNLAVKKGNQEKMAEFGKRRDELEELLKTYDARYEYNGKLITQAEYDKLSQADKKKAIIKYMSKTIYKNSVAIGYDAQALANDAVAIGNGAKVIVDGSKKIVAGGGVAIGQGSVSNARENTDLKGYKPGAYSIDEDSSTFKNNKSAWIATNQPFAVGDDSSKEKITRQITGVAAGNKDTDAVNVAQLKQIGFKAAGDIGIGTIQNENDENNILNIKTNGSWENKQTKIVYTGKNLETKFTPYYIDQMKNRVYSTVAIAMTDTPRFKSITIANDDAVKGLEDNSPIELKKFDDKTNNNTIGFAGKGDSTIKLTNLSDGNIAKDSTDAVTGKQLYEVQEKTNTLAITPLKFADNNNNIIERKLGNTLRISGGQNADIKEDYFTIGENIGVFKKYNDNLAIALAKNLKNITSISNGDKGAKITLEKDNKNIFVNGAKITNVAEGDITKDSTDAVNGKQLYEVKNELKNNINSKVSDVTGKNNIKVESDPNDTTKKIVSLEKDIDLTDGGSIKFGSGKTDITKDKITSKDLVATNGTNKVTISGDDGTITGLTNTTWDKNNIVENRAATEGQLKDFQKNLGSNIDQTLQEEYQLTGNRGNGKVYKNKAINIIGDDTNIKTVAADGNLNITLLKKLNLKDGSITFDKTKLDEDGLKVGDDVKITKDTIQNGDVKLTKDGLNNGSNKITKVADGEADDDAATVRQLKNIAVGASGVKESDKKDDWAKEKPKATGKNSVSIAGGSKDNGRSNTVSVGAPGHERTISNVAPGVLNSDAATVGQLKAGLNNVHGKLDEYKKDSRAGTASAMAIGNLPQSTIPGKGMVSLGGGFYDGESAMAIGLSKMSDDGKWVVKGSASYDSQENAGAAVSVGFHF